MPGLILGTWSSLFNQPVIDKYFKTIQIFFLVSAAEKTPMLYIFVYTCDSSAKKIPRSGMLGQKYVLFKFWLDSP